jgi:hypothetical protein
VDPHQVTLSVKGTGKWSFSVLSNGDRTQPTPTAFELKEGGDWQRIHIPFQPQLKSKLCSLRIQGNGKLWLDGLRAALASQGEDDASQGECEVALAIPDTEISPARIQFSTEAPQMRYAVTGQLAKAQLRGKVFHADGSSADLLPVSLDAKGTQSGLIKFDVFPGKPLGVFRIEAWVERDGQRISPPAESVVTRIRRPRYWKQNAPQSHFGAQFGPDSLSMLEAKAIGLNWVRCHGPALPLTAWAFLERKSGEWVFPDAAIDRLKSNHFNILGQLGTVPPWASYHPKTEIAENLGYSENWFQPEKLGDWKKYVRKIAEHYKGKIDIYDVWDDPTNPSTFAVSWKKQIDLKSSPFVGSPFPQKDYANLLQATSIALKEGNLRSIHLAGFNPHGQIKDSVTVKGATAWMQGVLDFGGWNAADIIAYHDRGNSATACPGDSVEESSNRIHWPLRQRLASEHKPIWMTDALPGQAAERFGFYHYPVQSDGPKNTTEKADALCRFIVSTLGSGVEKVFLPSMGPTPRPFLTNRNYNPGILASDDGYLNANSAALANLAWNLDHLTFDRRVEVVPGIFAYIFKDFTTETAVLARKPGVEAVFKLPNRAGVARVDLFGNSVVGDATVGTSVIYLTTPRLLIDMDAVLAGRRWIISTPAILATLCLVAMIVSTVWVVRHHRRKNSSR